MYQHWQTVALLTESALFLTLRIQERPYPEHDVSELPRQAALLYTGLERKGVANGDATSWRAKPKLHLMQELMSTYALKQGPLVSTGLTRTRAGARGWPKWP